MKQIGFRHISPGMIRAYWDVVPEDHVRGFKGDADYMATLLPWNLGVLIQESRIPHSLLIVPIMVACNDTLRVLMRRARGVNSN